MELEDFNKYDLALRVWERIGYVSDREGSPFVYYNPGLNEYRLDRYLITEEKLTEMTTGGWWLIDKEKAIPVVEAGGKLTDISFGEIIGCKTEGVIQNDRGEWQGLGTPGYWIVLNNGQIDIVPGSVSRKPIRVVVNDETK